jgi:hypothetical protein
LEHNADVSQESVIADVLTKGGYSGADLIATANKPEVKAKRRGLTAEA